MVGLAFGLVLDVFFPPYGAHAFSGLWVWALRGFWARIVRPFQSPDEVPHPETFSLGEWTLYAFPLCLVYLLELFLTAGSIMESYPVDAPQRQLFVSWDFGDFCDFYPAE